jgi:hypothetical protein
MLTYRVNLELQPGPFTVSSYVERVRQIKWQNVMLMLSLCHLKQYFSYIVAVSFIGGGNRSTRRKPPTCRKSLTNFITYCCIKYIS